MCVLRFSYAMMEVTDGSTGVLLITLVNSAAACKPKHHDALNASALHSVSICHIICVMLHNRYSVVAKTIARRQSRCSKQRLQ